MNLSSSREAHRKERAAAETNRICSRYDSMCSKPIKYNIGDLTSDQLAKFRQKIPAKEWLTEATI